jgi:hypothetical protein
MANLGVEQFALHRYAAAAMSLTAAHGGLARALGPNKPLTLFSGYYLARTLVRTGDPDRAAELAAKLNPGGLSGAEPGAPADRNFKRPSGPRLPTTCLRVTGLRFRLWLGAGRFAGKSDLQYSSAQDPQTLTGCRPRRASPPAGRPHCRSL